MDQSPHSAEQTISDDEMVRRIGYCGVLVTLVAFAIAWVANTVA